jgi:hypothetical protein
MFGPPFVATALAAHGRQLRLAVGACADEPLPNFATTASP